MSGKSNKQKGTNGYVTSINAAIRAHLEKKEIPVEYTLLIKKTAQDMLLLDRVMMEIEETDALVITAPGSTGQDKTIVSPLLPYYDKLSARVTDDLYNLGLTARKQAAKCDDPADKRSKDAMEGFVSATINN